MSAGYCATPHLSTHLPAFPPHPPFTADGDGEFLLDSLAWPAPRSIAASGLWYDVGNEDEPESMDAYLLAITWQAWQGEAAAAPAGLEARLTSYVTLQVRGKGAWYSQCIAALQRTRKATIRCGVPLAWWSVRGMLKACR